VQENGGIPGGEAVDYRKGGEGAVTCVCQVVNKVDDNPFSRSGERDWCIFCGIAI